MMRAGVPSHVNQDGRLVAPGPPCPHRSSRGSFPSLHASAFIASFCRGWGWQTTAKLQGLCEVVLSSHWCLLLTAHTHSSAGRRGEQINRKPDSWSQLMPNLELPATLSFILSTSSAHSAKFLVPKWFSLGVSLSYFWFVLQELLF